MGSLRLLPFVCVLLLGLWVAACPSSTSNPDGSTSEALPEILGEPQPLRCNGHTALCSRRYDQVVYPMTHNAMSNQAEAWAFPNQNHPILTQLKDGIRGMMLDVHLDEEKAHLCHGYCALGKKLLLDGLKEIAQWLKDNPHEVLTFIYESHVKPDLIKAGMEESGLLAFTHTQAADQEWPTLEAMIRKNTRLVVFTESDGGTYPWYMDVWKYTWETAFSIKTSKDFTCEKNRGSSKDNKLFLLNHFLTNPLPSPDYAKEVNANPFFLDRAKKCQTESGRLPNFLAVDFHDLGDIFAVARALNGLP